MSADAKSKIRQLLRTWEPEQFSSYRESYDTMMANENMPRMMLISFVGIVTALVVQFIFYDAHTILLATLPQGVTATLSFVPGFTIILLTLMLFTSLYMSRSGAEAGEKRVLFFLVMFSFITLMSATSLIEVLCSSSVYTFFVTCIAIMAVPFYSSIATILLFSYFGIAFCGAAFVTNSFSDQDLGFRLFLFIVVTLAAFIFRMSYNNHQIRSYTALQKIDESGKEIQKANETLKTLNLELEKLSATDQLTNIYNRRALDEYLVKTWNECRRSRQPMTLIMVDIDRFKYLNDSFGHQRGDDCLRTVAACINGFFNRSVDMFARFGGEEFMAILPFTSGDSVLPLAEKIRVAVQELKIPNPLSEAGPYVTVSMGLASRYAYQIDSIAELVDICDKACYAAKKTGRNRIVSNTAAAAEIFAYASSDLGLEALYDNLEVTNVIIKINTDSIFLLDLTTRSIVFQPDIVKYVDLESPTLKDVHDLIDIVAEDEKPSFLSMVDQVLAAEDRNPRDTVFRLKTKHGGFVKALIKVGYIYNDKHEPVKAAGSVKFVD